jgi:hypothetical protein
VPQLSPTPGINSIGGSAFGIKSSAAAGMRNDTLDSMLHRNNQVSGAAFGMRPSFGQGAVGGQLPSVAPPPQSGLGNKYVLQSSPVPFSHELCILKEFVMSM